MRNAFVRLAVVGALLPSCVTAQAFLRHCWGTVEDLPANSPSAPGPLCTVTDGADESDCTVGGGSESVLCRDTGSAWVAAGGGSGGGSGTVTSVALTVPSQFTLSGSPITTTGTFALGLSAQSANQVWAGPVSGGPAAPGFRDLEAVDIPDLTGPYPVLGVSVCDDGEFLGGTSGSWACSEPAGGGGGSSAGSSGALQASDGSGGFVDGGATLASGALGTAAITATASNESLRLEAGAASTTTYQVLSQGGSIRTYFGTAGGAAALIDGAEEGDTILRSNGLKLRLGHAYNSNRIVIDATGVKVQGASAGGAIFRVEPLATAPATCTIGDQYVDTSGAYCGCASTNVWENLGTTGSCA